MEKIYNLTETKNITEDFSPVLFDVENQKEIMAKPEKIKRDNEEVSVTCIVLLVDSKQMPAKDGSYNVDLLGNPMFQYVVRACPSVPTCIKYNEETDSVLSIIKPYLKDTEYTLVLFSDTPLVTRANVLNILDFAKAKGLNVCKLTRGYVFKNEYIKRVDEIYAPSTYYFEEEDFMIAVSYKQLYIISEILKNRIISFHMQNGVYFKAPDSTYIDANVSIGAGTVVEPFVRMTGDTDIQENAFIGAGSTLINAKILDGAKVFGAYVDGGIIMEKAKVKNGAKLLSQTAIKEGAEIGEDSIISNAIIGEHSMIGKNTIVNYFTAEENVCVGDNCKIVGTEEKPCLMQKGSKIEDMVTLMQGVKISSGTTIKMGEVVKAGDK